MVVAVVSRATAKGVDATTTVLERVAVVPSPPARCASSMGMMPYIVATASTIHIGQKILLVPATLPTPVPIQLIPTSMWTQGPVTTSRTTSIA
jgi:hypothetical protein